MRADRNFDVLKHMIRYCEEISETVDRFGNDYALFVRDTIYKNAVALCVLQIGELTTKLTQEFKDSHREIPWTQMKAMRNIVAHSYGSIDTEILWETIENDIPSLKEYCLRVLEQFESEKK